MRLIEWHRLQLGLARHDVRHLLQKYPIGLLDLGASVFEDLLFLSFDEGVAQTARFMVVYEGLCLKNLDFMDALVVLLPLLVEDAVELW